jgi:hypothetical protein
MLFGDLDPHMIEKHWQLHFKGWVWFGSDYIIETWFQNNFIYTKLIEGLAPKEKNKYNYAFDSQKKKCCINPCNFLKSDTKTLFYQT